MGGATKSEKDPSKGSRKHDSTKDKLGPEGEFQFINIMDPLVSKSKASRKAVRSYVARVAHQRVRRNHEMAYGDADDTGDCLEEKSQAEPAQEKRQEAALRNTLRQKKSALGAAHATAAPMYTPIDVLTTWRGDPFQASAMHLTSFEQYLVDHFVQIVIPRTAVYYPRSKSEPSYKESMNLHWMPFALADLAVLNGLLSAACRSLALLHNADQYLHAAFMYNGRCIRSISEAISKEGKGAGTDSTICTVLLLASTEHGQTSCTLQDLEKKASTESILPGFQTQSIMYQLSVDMINMLNDICAYTDHINKLSCLWSETEHRSLISAADEFDARLLVMGSDYQNQISARKYTRVEECICLSLKVFVCLMPHKNSFPPMGCKHLSTRIGEVLSGIMLVPSWYQNASLCLWLPFMGSIVARAGEVKEQDLADFFGRLHKQTDILDQFEGGVTHYSNFWIFLLLEIGSVLGVTSKEDVKLHLRQFLWVESLCEPYSVDIWGALERMQFGLSSLHDFEAFGLSLAKGV